MMTPPSDPARWPEVKRLFETALDLAAADRTAFLDQSCRAPDGTLDTALRASVETLLSADAHANAETETTGGFLAGSPLSLGGLLDGLGVEQAEGPTEAAPGTRIGPYRILRLLGRGGMGEVYLAHRADGLFEREVALKRVRADLAPGVAARFSTERQILADLTHPGIARLYAAGTDDEGRPWIALEPVDGVPITDYARDHALGDRDRVGLILQVCAAVQHAHSKSVIHRDLKPSNVLVVDHADGPQVRLLDFGIAHILGGDRDAQRFLTRAYASPEQLRGEPATAASDVYGLGALLAETLTGQRPAGAGDVRGLSGDLGAVAARALASTVGDRYGSAETLADDLRRWRENLPVAALAPTLGYRVRRFARRHRVPVGIGVLALLVALAAATAVGIRVDRERAVAQRAVADADAVAETQGALLRVLEPSFRAQQDSLKDAPVPPTIGEAVDQAVETVEATQAEAPGVLAGNLLALGTTYFERGQLARADALFARSLALRRPLGREGDGVVRNALIGRGHVAAKLEDRTAAQRFYRQALDIEREHPEMISGTGASSTEMFLAAVLDDADASERILLQTLAERRETFAEDATQEAEILVAQAHNALGVHFLNRGNYRAAIVEYRTAAAIVRRHVGELHPATNTLRGNLAYAAAAMGQYEEAERHARIGLDAVQRGSLGVLREATMRQAIGQALYHQDDLEGAERELLAADALFASQGEAGAPKRRLVRGSLAALFAEQGRLGEALAIAEDIEAEHRRNGTVEGPEGVLAQAKRAALRFALGPRDGIVERLAGLARDIRRLDAPLHIRASVLHLAGDALRESGDARAAEPLLREALAVSRESLPDDHLTVLHDRFHYARALAALGRMEEARPHLEAARGHVRRVSYPSVLEDPDTEIDRLLARR